MLIEQFRSCFKYSIASFNVPGKSSIPASLRSRARHRIDVAVDSYRNFHFFFNPSRPAVKIAAIAKYGFADGSTLRNSIRVEMPQILEYGSAVNGYVQTMQYIQALRILELKRLYEFTVGLHTAVKGLWHVS